MIHLACLHDRARDALPGLLDVCFGPDRHNKIAYRFRDSIDEDQRFALSAHDGPMLVGAIQYWPCHVSKVSALLLGPLAVAPAYRNQGIARLLVNQSLEQVRQHKADLIVLIGDPELYRQYGFVTSATQGLTIEGEPVERVQIKALTPKGQAATGEVLPGA